VPFDEPISFADLSKKVNVDELTLSRLLRNAMTFYMFHEPKKGYVAHTADSRLLVEDQTLYDYIGCSLEDLRPGAHYMVDAIEKWPGSQEPNETGFNVAWNTDLPLYRYLMQHPERIRRASALMTQVTQAGARAAKKIAYSYPWAALGYGTVVDMGGGNGHISIALAREHPNLKFVVQDLPGVSAQGEANLPAELKDQVSFMPHDFFTENPVKDAAAFFFMNTIHTWSDKYVVKIFQHLTSSIQPGARILVCDRVIPERGTVPDIEYKEIRSVDLYMMHNVNGRERTVEDIFGLFSEADPRFKFFNSYKSEDCMYTICEAFWVP
jgi:O-methyltransferase domain